MVDPRIYRSGLALVAAAAIVLAFSLSAEPAAAPTSISPAALTGLAPYSTFIKLAKRFPGRAPGSPGDRGLARYVASQLQRDGAFTVRTTSASLRTARGTEPIDTVTATRPGLTPGALVLLSERDAPEPGSVAGLSGTAVMLDLAHTLAGESLNHTLLLVSTSGSIGQAGATQVARSLAGQQVDAVIALGDLGSEHGGRPAVDPFSDGENVTPPLLRRTLGRFESAASGAPPSGTGLTAQFSHLAFPLTLGPQGPFSASGIPAVGLSDPGDPASGGSGPISSSRLRQSEDAVLQTLSALDRTVRVQPPSAYLLVSGNVLPAWAVRLLVLALIAPVLLAIVDAVARSRRRGHSILRWACWWLASAAPFLLALVVLLIVRWGGLLPVPPGPVAGGVPVGAGGAALLVILAIILVGGFVWLRPRIVRVAGGLGAGRRTRADTSGDAAAVTVMLLLSLTVLVLWAGNPFAALLFVPALHLWLWLSDGPVRGSRPLLLAAIVLGLAPSILVAIYYAHAFGLTPLGLIWSSVLLVLGGQLSVPAAFGICVLGGSAASMTVIALRAAPTASSPAQVTVRGPVSYAGPGSLGGTESALGSRR